MPEDGRPTGDPAVYGQFLPVIKQRTDAVVNISASQNVPEKDVAGPQGGSPEDMFDEMFKKFNGQN